MSVFTKQAFTMSAMPTPASSQPGSAVPSRRNSFARAPRSAASGTITPAVDPHIVSINVESVLFDMDGTLINSSPAVVKAWELFSQTYPLDLDDILRSAHGMRTIDVLKKWCGITDPKKLEEEVVRFESKILEAAEDMAKTTGKSGIEVLPGVRNLLAALNAEKYDRENDEEKWAICTSSTYFYAGKAIPIAKLPVPNVFVTADSVTRGKPFPDPYLLGAEGCNASAFESIVVEDAPTGIRAGKAAGCKVLATCTSHERKELEKERPDYLVEDLSHVQARWDKTTKTFEIIIEQPVDRVDSKATPDVTPVVTPAGSRMNSFSGVDREVRNWKPSDELTGNDSVVGSPVPSRPGSPGAENKAVPDTIPGASSTRATQGLPPKDDGVTLDAFKKALAGNAMKQKREINMED